MYEAPPGTAAGASAAATSSMASRTPWSSMTSREATVSPNTEQYFSTVSSRSRQAIPTWSILVSMIGPSHQTGERNAGRGPGCCPWWLGIVTGAGPCLRGGTAQHGDAEVSG
jgi:hypothetical protein